MQRKSEIFPHLPSVHYTPTALKVSSILTSNTRDYVDHSMGYFMFDFFAQNYIMIYLYCFTNSSFFKLLYVFHRIPLYKHIVLFIILMFMEGFFFSF